MAFGAVSSDAALAGSLLSGYGGPGQGNQALLGSALLKRPGGGSGSNGSGSNSASTSGTSSSTSATLGGTASNGSGSVSRSATRGKPRRSHVSGGASAASSGTQPGRSATTPRSIADVYAAAERGGPAPSAGTLGLSGADLLLILLALGMLGLIGALSWTLARSRSTGGPRTESGG
jgi:hypothetical protein